MEVIRIDYLNVQKIYKSSCCIGFFVWFTYWASSVVRQLYFEGQKNWVFKVD